MRLTHTPQTVLRRQWHFTPCKIILAVEDKLHLQKATLP